MFSNRKYIKKKLREQALKVVQSQIYILAKQQFQQFSLNNTVEIAVTDSPILLSPIYDPTQCKFLRGLAIKEYNKYNNLMYFIERDPEAKYEQEGRYQDLEGAKKVDKKVKDFLNKNKIKYKTLVGIRPESLITIMHDIMRVMKHKKGKEISMHFTYTDESESGVFVKVVKLEKNPTSKKRLYKII